MKLFRQIKIYQLQIELGDIFRSDRFQSLIENKYPEHAVLLKKYRDSMIMGLILIILVVSGLILYLMTLSQ